MGNGEGSHPGSELLKKSAAFKAFVITDTISMILSSSIINQIVILKATSLLKGTYEELVEILIIISTM
jgi:hypothetical protein